MDNNGNNGSSNGSSNVIFFEVDRHDMMRMLEEGVREDLNMSVDEFMEQLRTGKLNRCSSPTVSDLEDLAELAFIE